MFNCGSLCAIGDQSLTQLQPSTQPPNQNGIPHSTRYSTASAKVRKQCFEAFWYTHHLAFFFMLALFSHATGCFVRDTPNPDFQKSFPFYNTRHCLGYESWRFIIWPFVLYFGERILREVRARQFTRLEKVLVHPSGTWCDCRGNVICI